MSEPKKVKETATAYSAMTANLDHPVILERDGQPIAVLLSIEEYRALTERAPITAQEAQQAADKAVFGELVGCALNSGVPTWVPEPSPHWRIPYRFIDGTLLAFVHVDAQTASVSLTEEEREILLNQVEALSIKSDALS